MIESPMTTNCLFLPAFPSPPLLLVLLPWLLGVAVTCRVAPTGSATCKSSHNFANMLGCSNPGLAFLFWVPLPLPLVTLTQLPTCSS
uniref:Uncharacterized protein n=1 Tax=Pyxicephalus adspersus TaxID=30357 RepID=A0AAV3AAY4_PYXAD|nr:TPA: hypothetical protein GDO54_018024 [Pyxicephalus adspersus]